MYILREINSNIISSYEDAGSQEVRDYNILHYIIMPKCNNNNKLIISSFVNIYINIIYNIIFILPSTHCMITIECLHITFIGIKMNTSHIIKNALLYLNEA